MTLADTGQATSPADSVNANGKIEVMSADSVDLDSINTDTTASSDVYTTSDGLIFKLTKVNPHIIMEAGRKMIEPRIPVVFIEDKGRSEENPSDPDYQQALQEFQMERGMLVVNTHLAFGTRLTNPDALPDGKKALDDPEWAEDLKEVLNLDIPVKGKARYLRWLKFHLLSDEDMNGLAGTVMRYSGRVTETDVAEAESAFRDNESGPADQGLSVGTEIRSADNNQSTS